MDFIAWPDIESFFNVRKALIKYPHLYFCSDDAPEDKKIIYNSKIKLDGTNGAVRLGNNGDMAVQSRTKIITPEDDNAGFAKFIYSNKDKIIERKEVFYGKTSDDITIYGEWAGKGLQKGMAVCLVEQKFFAVFAVQIGDKFFVDPIDITNIVFGMPFYVLPWHSKNHVVSIYEENDCVRFAEECNKQILEIEDCDPWIKSQFDIEGPAEGLVYYPITHQSREGFKNLAFKAKSEKKRVVKTEKAVQINPEVAANVDKFVELMVTEPRLEQGARFVANGNLEFDTKLIGQFMGWLAKDVNKESQAELEASGLKWEDVSKKVQNAGRDWYLKNVKKI